MSPTVFWGNVASFTQSQPGLVLATEYQISPLLRRAIWYSPSRLIMVGGATALVELARPSRIDPSFDRELVVNLN